MKAAWLCRKWTPELMKQSRSMSNSRSFIPTHPWQVTIIQYTFYPRITVFFSISLTYFEHQNSNTNSYYSTATPGHNSYLALS